MPVTVLPGRQLRHPAGHTEPVTAPFASLTRPGAPTALTVTLNIPLTGEALPPQARRLLEAVCELVEAGEGEVSITDPIAVPATFDLSGGDEIAAVPAPAGSAVEVRLLMSSRQVLVGGELMALTRLEFDLLQFLTAHPRRVFTRMQLLTGVWGYDHTGERTVDVHVRRLRVKMGAVPLITTVYGVGYRLADDACVVVDPQN